MPIRFSVLSCFDMTHFNMTKSDLSLKMVGELGLAICRDHAKTGHRINYSITWCPCHNKEYKPLVFLASLGCMKTSSLYFLVWRPFTDHSPDHRKWSTRLL